MTTITHSHRRSRQHGTVLIFVVGVLVLLALAATAFLSTARTDRITTKQNEFNTQVDLLLDGVRQAAIATIVNDQSMSDVPATFEAADYPLSFTDDWLGARVPTRFDLTLAFDVNSNPGIWRAITGPFLSTRFESPTGQATSRRTDLYPFGVSYNGLMQPVFGFDLDGSTAGVQPVTGTNLSGTGNNFLFAGDADGEGIADSLPQRLPVGKLNGITYYAYVRIIDHASAINVNTAMSRDFDYTGDLDQTLVTAGVGNKTLWKYGFFSTDIGIAEMLRDYTQPMTPPAMPTNMGANFQELLEYRANNAAPSGVAAATPAGTPVSDSGNRPDFLWLSWGDAYHHQQTLRQANPGFVSAGTRFRSFDISEASSLASKFVLADALGSSQIENTLSASLLSDPSGTARTVSYAANDAGVWFDRYFRYEEREDVTTPQTAAKTGTFLSRRPLLVTESNTRDLLPNAALAGTILPFNPDATPKASINTASVDELFRSFYMTLLDTRATVATGNAGTIYPPAAINTFYNGTEDPYTGMRFDNATQDAVSPGEMHPAHVLRSPIRSTPTIPDPLAYSNHVRIEAAQMAKLRAAIAAVNTDFMRRTRQAYNDTGAANAPDTIQYKDVPIIGKQGSGDVNLIARVFGISRQPFLTEVFAHTDQTTKDPGVSKENLNGYIALELYNPHDFPIDISNCRFAAIVRHGPSARVAPFSNSPDNLVRMVIDDLSQPPPNGNTGRTATDVIRLNDPTAVTSNYNAPTDYAHPMIVPARGYLILENYDASDKDTEAAAYRPGSVKCEALQIPGGSVPTSSAGISINAAYVKNLHLLFNREFVLMRPLGASMVNQASVVPPPLAGSGLSAVVPTLRYDLVAGSSGDIRDDFMPLDSFDLSGLMLIKEKDVLLKNITDNLVWHYNRKTPTLVDSDGDTILDRWQGDWQFVYPGRYDASKSEVNPVATRYEFHARQQGTNQSGPFDPLLGEFDPWDTTAKPTAGKAPTPPPSFGAPASSLAQDKVFTIQLFSKDWPGPNVPAGATSNVYPFGQFARLGDLLQVPFIGAYRIIRDIDVGNPLRVVEVNSVTMDAMMAEDTDMRTDPQLSDNGWDSREQIGRFAPLRAMTVNDTTYDGEYQTDPNSGSYSDYATTGTAPDGSNPLYRYAFGRKLFDYFTVQAPHDDGMPNALPANYAFWTANTKTQITAPRPPPVNALPPEAVSNSGLVANDVTERVEPLKGLININTAPAKVLAMIPWVQSRDELRFDVSSSTWLTNAANNVSDNEDFAYAFVAWRDGNAGTGTAPKGPINNLMDLYKCPAFVQLQSTALMGEPDIISPTLPNREPDDREGDVSPFNPTITRGNMRTTDGIRYDFEEQYLGVNRVSNLLTTRSDTYTVYILLEGYRNAGTATPELVVARRAAMIVDRSRYVPTNTTVSATRVPTN
jgi:hypothetical protein